MLCCGNKDDRKHALQISSPTDVRRVDICIPGLSEEHQAFIREKAATDAHRLFTMQPPSPSPSPSLPNSNSLPSISSSSAPLNPHLTTLPSNLPTPPRQKHSDAHLSNLPVTTYIRMKSVWEHTRRLSASLNTRTHGGYRNMDREGTGKGGEEDEMVKLSFDIKERETETESPNSVKRSEWFDIQGVKGGIGMGRDTIKMDEVRLEERDGSTETDGKSDVVTAGQGVVDGETSSGSDGEGDVDTTAERKPFVSASKVKV
ncbi:hypothetical protein K469DRAFT_92868 [Zopfia rhizophila CBS 207.26]|uniref:Uncharacterized protein n=1 Tax=Zopfia rhizophila CBS 207.26 TaxID=1314779 RepID=A0A6A6EAT0_9PEZI|nr:hypothetical protein K469DRAFT_92868 [Zopfia rhizophila CBS 207.26]